ncbi:AAA family ATPase [Tsukamurella soli]|uniref:AAA family ATPase n=1 Tax=Tsukamurella soli TaxID=644556 RepID=A0ABP8KFM8_9ACTN
MLQYLRLRGAPAFDPTSGTDIGPLNPANFFFGPNGSGKTTISRALADEARYAGTTLEWHPPTSALGVKVYNSDYVNATLTPAGHFPGVFLLGETNAQIQAEIESLRDSIATAKAKLVGLQSSLATKNGEIDRVRTALKDAAWAKRNDVPVDFREMFAGYNNSKDRLLDRLLKVPAANTSAAEDFTTLASEARAVFAEDAHPLSDLPLGREIRIEAMPGHALLDVVVVGSADVGLAPLIQQLSNADWVRQGRAHLQHADGVCPFCQQSVPSSLGNQLEAYFDRTYIEQTKQLMAFNEYFESWAQHWAAYLDDLPARPGAVEHLDGERFAAARTALEKVIADAQAQISAKLAAPSTKISVPDPSPQIDGVNVVVRDANKAIENFNSLLNNRSSVKNSFLDRCWLVFARVTLVAELSRYEGAMSGHLKGKQRIEEQIASAATDVDTKESRRRELLAKVTSSRPIIDRINRLLDSVGFHSFSLAESTAIQDGYTLVRSNGENATDTLSEGERTFITFLYFAQSLQGSPQNEGETSDLLAVIDDPISSLDSDVLYAVSTIVRGIVEGVAAGSGRVRQLVLMTHNSYFYKEVTYRPRGGKLGSWKYGLVRKWSGKPSEVEFCDDNPIQTAYGALWDEVKRSAERPSASAVGLQNTLRRILEAYFKVLGGVDDPAIVAKFEGDEQLICRSLFSWVNAGSHSIFDDLDYSPTPSTVDANLRVFRRIFEIHDQFGHYLMMMGESADVSSAETPE